MKTVSMSGFLRESVGKKDAKKSRQQGMVPCVMYGGAKQMHFLIEESNFKHLIFTPEVKLAEISIEETIHIASLQDVQYHPVTDKILHVDFYEINPDTPFIISLPVLNTGTPAGVLKGGKFFKKYRKIKVKGLLKDMPENIVLNVENLEIGESIRVSDIHIDNIKLLDIPNAIILEVQVTRAVETPEVAAGEAKPAAETPAGA
jgi:large subunit ribosomal protein L25